MSNLLNLTHTTTFYPRRHLACRDGDARPLKVNSPFPDAMLRHVGAPRAPRVKASGPSALFKRMPWMFRERTAASRDLHSVHGVQCRTRLGSHPTRHDLLHAIPTAPGSGTRSRPPGWCACI